MTGVYLAVYSLWRGNFPKASFIVTYLGELAQIVGVSEMTLITVKVTEALHDFFTFSCESACRKIHEALSLGEETGVHVWDIHVMGHGIFAAMSIGDTAMAELFLKRIETKLPMAGDFDIAYYNFCFAWKARIAGELDRAYESLGLGVEIGKRAGNLVGHAAASIAIAEIEYQRGNRLEASAHLDCAYGIARRYNSKPLEYMCLLVEAQDAVIAKEADRTVDLLRQAMAIGREFGIMNMFWWQPAAMLTLCMKALAADIEVDYVRKLIRKRNLVPETPLFNLDNWPWPVKLVTLGRFELLVNDQPAKSSRKPSYKQMEMLKVLVALGGIETSEEKVRDLLWPDSDGDTARDLFKVTLHRLRKLLGNDQAIRFKEGRIALDRRYVWVDAWAFEYNIRNAKESGNRCEDGNPAAFLQKAIALYGGHFLESEAEYPWQLSMRDRLHHKHLAAVLALTDYYENNGQQQTALETINAGLEKAPLAEPLYQRLMNCYHSSGLLVEAANSYRRGINTLTASGIEPSSEIIAVFRRMSLSS